jgi:hypothetical protein
VKKKIVDKVRISQVEIVRKRGRETTKTPSSKNVIRTRFDSSPSSQGLAEPLFFPNRFDAMRRIPEILSLPASPIKFRIQNPRYARTAETANRNELANVGPPEIRKPGKKLGTSPRPNMSNDFIGMKVAKVVAKSAITISATERTTMAPFALPGQAE